MPEFIFDASESLLRLAAQTGAAENFNMRAARDQALVESVRRQQAQQDALRFEREKLDLQLQQQRLGQRTPTGSRVLSSPFTRSAEQAVAKFKAPSNLNLDPQTAAVFEAAQASGDRNTIQQILQQSLRQAQRPSAPGSGEVSGGGTAFTVDTQGNLTGREDQRDLTVPEIRERGGFVGPGRPAPREDPLTAAKQQVLAQFPGLSPEAAASLQPLVNDPEISTKDIVIQASKLRERGVSPGQQLQLQSLNLGASVRDIDREAGRLEEALESEGLSVLGRSASDLLRDVEQRTAGGFAGFGADDAKRERLTEMVLRLGQLRAQRQQVRGEQQSLPAGLIAQQAAPQADESDVSTLSTEDLFRELLGQ